MGTKVRRNKRKPAPGVLVPERPRRWMEPMRDEWEAVNGKGTFPWAQAGQYLQPLRKEWTDEQIAQHLAVYLKRTPAAFINLYRFSLTIAQYDPAQYEIPLVDEFGMLKES